MSHRDHKLTVWTEKDDAGGAWLIVYCRDCGVGSQHFIEQVDLRTPLSTMKAMTKAKEAVLRVMAEGPYELTMTA